MTDDIKTFYERHYHRQETMAWPAEYVIRIFKGSYPDLSLPKETFPGSRICDVGCGDGRNIVVLGQVGFELYGTEIDKSIADKARQNLSGIGIDADIRVGTNSRVPFNHGFFDYLLSWNACYYMGENREFDKHVKEFARVLQEGGRLVLSVPKLTAFIYENCEPLKDGLVEIKDDPFGIRNGQVLRMFQGESDIVRTFSPYFDDFTFGSIHDNCFGFAYHWHLAVCRRTEFS